MIKRTNSFQKQIAFSVISILLSPMLNSVYAYPGDDKTGNNCCQIIDKTHPSLDIQFERTGTSEDEGIKEQTIWLRVRNNMTCVVLFSTPNNPDRFVNGVLTNNIRDGEEVHVNYYLMTPSGRQSHYKQDFFMMFRLSPGSSFIFDVPIKYFRSKWTIHVPFEFDWETSMMTGNTHHEIWCSSYDLPADWEKTAEKRH